MTFIVILVSLLIERFFDWGHVRDWNWFWPYQRAIQKLIGKPSPYISIIAAILPLCVGVYLADYLLSEWLYGFLTLVFNIFILVYCLGPQNLWADTFSTINVLKEGDLQFGAEKLNLAFNAVSAPDSQAQHHALLNAIFIAADRRVFAMIFWYAILGPAGAILYRVVALTIDPNVLKREATSLSQFEVLENHMRRLETLLNWLPARIFTFLFALAGHFMQVFYRWKRLVWQGLSVNDELLVECGWAALGKTSQDVLPLDGSVERSAVNLLGRVFVIMLVIIALSVWLV